MIVFIIIWILRIFISLLVGWAGKYLYNSDDKYSNYYKGNRFIIYHDINKFLTWCIPLFGWIYSIIRMIKKPGKS